MSSKKWHGEDVKKKPTCLEAFGMTLKGVDYTPLLVAKQLVSGYNYRFICMTKTVTREPKYGFAKVTIYAPLKGEPLLESIVEY